MKLAQFIMAACLAPLCCAAQIVNPRPATNPVQPSPRSPEGLTKGFSHTPIALKWRQALFGSILGNEAPASYFHLCVYNPVTESCASTSYRWTLGANTLTRTAVTTPTNPSVVIAHDYSYPISLPLSYFNKQIVWRVGACSSTSSSSCTFADTPTWLSNLDVVPLRIPGGLTETFGLAFGGDAQITYPATFTSNLRVWNARATAAGECITDVNDPSVDVGTDSVLLGTGEIIPVSALPMDANGNRDAGVRPPVGIIIGAPIGEETVTDDLDGWETIVILRNLPQPPLPAAFGARFAVDTGQHLREFNETNNVRGECKRVDETLYESRI